MQPLGDDSAGELLIAGSVVPPGRYHRIDVGAGRTVVLERDDYLPASLDGHVAVYRRLATPIVLRVQPLPASA